MTKNLLFFYKSSYGELLTGLPLVLEILKKKELNAFFIYSDEELFKNIPLHYKDLVLENFQIIKLKKNNFLGFVKRFVFQKNYIFTCDSGHTVFSKILLLLSLKSRLVFFAHAYALIGDEIDPVILKKFKCYKNRVTGAHHYPLVLSHNSTEVVNRKNFGFLDRNVIVSGNIGYRKEWLDIVFSSSNTGRKLKELKQSYKNTIFIPTRDVHDSYLAQENSDYLFAGVKEAIKQFPNYLFVIKMHPRQTNKEMFAELQNELPNIMFTDISTMEAGSIADLTISYWSSAITDVLAVGGVAVEFHRHETYHTQLVEKDGSLISLYHHYGLCPFYENTEDILELLANPESWAEIGEQQQKVFNAIFTKEYPDFVEQLFERFDKTPFRFGYFADLFDMGVYTLKFIINKLIGRK